MNKSLKLSAAAFVAIAALHPAFAAASKTSVSTAALTTSRGAAGAETAAARQVAKKYCHSYERPVSRIPGHSCRTIGEWVDARFEVITKK